MQTHFPESRRWLLAFFTIFLLGNTVFAQADLAVSMRTNAPTFAPWTFVTFYVTVKNLSTTNTSSGVICSFPMPVDGRYNCEKLSKGEWHAWETTGPWTIGTLAPGDSATLQTTMYCMDAPTLVGTATVSATTADPLSTNNSATKTVTKGAEAPFLACTTTIISDSIDLELTLTTSNPEVNVNGLESFVLTIFNKSSKNATGVKLLCLLPSTIQYTAHNVAGLGTYNPVTGIWDIGNLGSNSSHAMTLNGTIVQGGPIKIVTQVTAANEPDIDSQINNYNATAAQDDEKDLNITGMLADMSVQVAAAVGTPSQITVGSQVSFVVNLTNSGPTRADGVKVRALPPSGMSFVSATTSIGVYDPSVGVWLLSTTLDGAGNKPGFTVQSNTTQTMTLTFLVTRTGNLVFDAEMRSSNMPDPNSTPSNNILTENDEAQVFVTATNSVDLTAADLELSQNFIKNPINAGDSIVYTIGIFNRGPAAATNIVVANLIPAGITVTATPSVGGSFSANNWNIASLPLNGTAVLTFRGISGCLTTAAKHFAQVQSATQNDPDSPHGNDTNQVANEDDEASLNLGATNCNTLLADLELSTTVLKNPVLNGDSVVFQLVLTNKGLQPAINVSVKDVLPTALNITTISPSVGTFSVDTWTIGNIAVNQTDTLTFRGKVTTLAVPTLNFAQVQTVSPADPDSSPGNDTTNTANEDDETLVTFAPTVAPNSDLELTMTTDKTSVTNGSTVSYTLTLVNKGNSTTTSVSVKDVLPTGLNFVNASTTQGTYASATGIWTVGTLAVNQSVSLTINVTVANIVTTIHNFAQVQTSALSDTDSQAGNNTTNIATEDDETAADIQSASASQCDLELFLTAPPQYATALPLYTTVNFTLKIKNKGLAAANGVTVKYVVPTGQAYSASTTTKGVYDAWLGNWAIGTLAAGDSAVLTLTLFTLQTTTTQFAQVQNSTTTDADSSPNNNTSNIPSEDDETLLSIPTANPVKLIDVQLTQTVTKALAKDGDAITFSIKIENLGDTAATNVVIKRLMPAGLSHQSSTVQQGTYNATTGIWSVGSLPSGASRILTITDSVGTMPSQFISFAQVISADQTDKDSQPNNNTSNTPNEDDEAAVTVLKQGSGSTCDLQLSITAPPQYAIYVTHTFTITLQNTGGIAATGIKIDVPIPTGFVNGGTTVTSVGTTYDAWLHTWTVPTLAAGQSVTMTLPCFPLVATPTKLFAQVTICPTLDADSQPNNNATTNPVEDDEAALTVTTGTTAQPFAQQNAVQTVPIVIQKIYPSATEGDLHIIFNSLDEREVVFAFYDFKGILRHSERRSVLKGKQESYFDVWDFPQGMYIVQVSSNRLRYAPVKFVKL